MALRWKNEEAGLEGADENDSEKERERERVGQQINELQR